MSSECAEATEEASKSGKSRRYDKMLFNSKEKQLIMILFWCLEIERANALKLLKFIQQAAACKTIGILSNESGQIAESFLSVIVLFFLNWSNFLLIKFCYFV